MNTLDWFVAVYSAIAGIMIGGLIMSKLEEDGEVSIKLCLLAAVVGVLWPIVVFLGGYQVWKSRL